MTALRHNGIVLFKIFLVVVLLGGAVWLLTSRVSGPRHPGPAQGERVYRFDSDVSYYYATSHEGRFVANTDLLYPPNLKALPLRLSEWTGEELPTDDANILYLRKYKRARGGTADKIYLVLVHGTTEDLFHTSEVCYLGEGWRVEQRAIQSMAMRGETFQVRYAMATKGTRRHLIFYWYLWPDSRRLMDEGMTMVRISVSVRGTLGEAERAAADFIRVLSDVRIDLQAREAVAIPEPRLPQITAGPRRVVSEWAGPKQAALDWLRAQMVANTIVAEPAQQRRHLLISYRVPPDSEDYRYVFSKASLYDNALAIIAFTMARDFRVAERIISAASRVLSANGDLWFTFNTHNSWPDARDHAGAIVRSGASAWLGYAILYYLKTRYADDHGLFRAAPQTLAFVKIAQSIADRVLTRQIADTADPRYGLVTGGDGHYSLRRSGSTGRVEEFFVGGPVPWISVEHNIDIYFFLRDLGRIVGGERYAQAAVRIREALLARTWNDTLGQFNRGQRVHGADVARALDCASWGSMFLRAVGEPEKSAQALRATARYALQVGPVSGFAPYRDLLVFDEPELNALLYPDAPDTNWNDIPLIWPEGTLGVAMAHILAGQRATGKQMIEQMLRLQDADGGLPYATEAIRFQFSKNPSVAGTAWFIMAMSALEDATIPQLFWEP